MTISSPSVPPPPLSAAEAARAILRAIAVQPALRVPLDQAHGLVLAEPVVSPIDVPPAPNAAMDGYAVRSEDLRGAASDRPVVLRVLGSIPAGSSGEPIGAGACRRIFTGAPIPAGADTVVRQEDTDLGATTVRVFSERDAGANIRPAGEDIRRGTLLFPAGRPLDPAALGVLASVGVAFPLVVRRPRVAILATGDEIADVDHADAILAGRKIGSSNTHTLMALVREAGGEPCSLGIAADAPESLRAHLTRAREADLVITTGGVSVGDHDHLRTIIAEDGALQFWRVRIRPGSPFAFGTIHGIPWLGLPGNPVSTMVTFELFGRPAIRRMAGHLAPFRRSRTVHAAEPIRVTAHLQHFLRAVIDDEGAVPLARLTGPQGSGILTSMAEADALLVVPEGVQEIPAGAPVYAIRLDEPVHQRDPSF